jgi:transposase
VGPGVGWQPTSPQPNVVGAAVMTRSLLVLADRLGQLGVTRVVMEATSDSGKLPFYLLEAAGFEVWLVNARDARAPARPAQDRPAAGPDPLSD